MQDRHGETSAAAQQIITVGKRPGSNYGRECRSGLICFQMRGVSEIFKLLLQWLKGRTIRMQTLNYHEEKPTGTEKRQSAAPSLLLFLPMKSAFSVFPSPAGISNS